MTTPNKKIALIQMSCVPDTQARYGRGRTLRLPHQLDHLLQSRGAPHLARLKPQAAGTIDRAAINRVAGLLIHRHAFARKHGFIDRRISFAHRAIHRDLLARAHHHEVAHAHLLDGNILFGAVAHHARGLGLQLPQMFRFVLCTSVNDEIVHGMPSAKRILKKGDIVSIDTGVQLDGYYGDSATTVAIGEVGEETRRLMRVTQEALELAIQQVKAGNRLFDVCGTVEKHVLANGFSVVREYVGHGIGTQLHEEPQVPNYVERKNENPRLKEGMVLAIEPMVNAGKPDTRVLKDKWTAVTKDGSYSAHFEHCVAVTSNGPWVLTRP